MKGKKGNILNKIRGIDYINIPEVKILIDDEEFIEFKNSKDFIGFVIIGLLIIGIALIINFIKQPGF